MKDRAEIVFEKLAVSMGPMSKLLAHTFNLGKSVPKAASNLGKLYRSSLDLKKLQGAQKMLAESRIPLLKQFEQARITKGGLGPVRISNYIKHLRVDSKLQGTAKKLRGIDNEILKGQEAMASAQLARQKAVVQGTRQVKRIAKGAVIPVGLGGGLYAAGRLRRSSAQQMPAEQQQQVEQGYYV